MTKTRAWLLIGIVLIASAYMAGFWPERQRARAAGDEVTSLQGRVAELEARVRLAEILGLLMRLSDSVVARNYGDASEQATAYFDRVGGEISASTQAGVQTVLQGIHESRDRVVAALARSEPMILEALREQEHALRRALSYPVPDRIPSMLMPPADVTASPMPGDAPAP